MENFSFFCVMFEFARFPVKAVNTCSSIHPPDPEHTRSVLQKTKYFIRTDGSRIFSVRKKMFERAVFRIILKQSSTVPGKPHYSLFILINMGDSNAGRVFYYFTTMKRGKLPSNLIKNSKSRTCSHPNSISPIVKNRKHIII